MPGVPCDGAPAATKLGPPLVGVFGRPRRSSDARHPSSPTRPTCGNRCGSHAAAVVAGFDRGGVGMPSYAGVLSDEQIESVILFLKSLK